MAAHPNVVPICLTTGTGPLGAETIFVQPPDRDPNSTVDLQREDTPINNEKSLHTVLMELQARGYTADSTPPTIKPVITPAAPAKPFRVFLANTSSKANPGKKKGKNTPKTPASSSRAPKPSVLTGTSNTSRTSQKKTFDQLLSDNIEYVLFLPSSYTTDTISNSRATAMNFRHQSRQQDLEEKRLLMEQLTIGLITKEDAWKRMCEIDEAARDLALLAAGGQPSHLVISKKSVSHATTPDTHTSSSENEEDIYSWGAPTP